MPWVDLTAQRNAHREAVIAATGLRYCTHHTHWAPADGGVKVYRRGTARWICASCNALRRKGAKP